MFIRHGEKPGDHGAPHGLDHRGEHDPHSLSVRGWTRAGALAALFAQGPTADRPQIVVPGRVIATKATSDYKSKREVQTATPLARRLGLAIDEDFDHARMDDLATALLSDASAPLVVWHHGSMTEVLARLPIANPDDVPQHWPDDRFDLIWVLTRDEDRYRFASVPQDLLDGDEAPRS